MIEGDYQPVTGERFAGGIGQIAPRALLARADAWLTALWALLLYLTVALLVDQWLLPHHWPLALSITAVAFGLGLLAEVTQTLLPTPVDPANLRQSWRDDHFQLLK